MRLGPNIPLSLFGGRAQLPLISSRDKYMTSDVRAAIDRVNGQIRSQTGLRSKDHDRLKQMHGYPSAEKMRANFIATPFRQR